MKQCEACQSLRNKPAQVDPPHPWIYPQKPWGRVHADFCEVAGKQYLLMVDPFSKWPEVHEVGTLATTAQTMDAMRRTVSYNGLPLRVVTDNGPQFSSHEFKNFMSANEIKHQLTPPYYPAANGQVERMVQEFKESLKTKPTGKSVSHQVSIFLLHYRTTPNSTTGKIPAELMLKRSPRTRLPLLRPEADSELREAQSQQYDTASGRV